MFSLCIKKYRKNILSRHPIRTLPMENLSKPTRTTNLWTADREPLILIRALSFGVLVGVFLQDDTYDQEQVYSAIVILLHPKYIFLNQSPDGQEGHAPTNPL
jgi:hypothetical protein